MLSQNKLSLTTLILIIGLFFNAGAILYLTQTMPMRGQFSDLINEVSSLRTEIANSTLSTDKSRIRYMSFLRARLHGENGSLVTTEIIFPNEGVLIHDIWLETKCPTIVPLKRTTARVAVSTEQLTELRNSTQPGIIAMFQRTHDSTFMQEYYFIEKYESNWHYDPPIKLEGKKLYASATNNNDPDNVGGYIIIGYTTE